MGQPILQEFGYNYPPKSDQEPMSLHSECSNRQAHALPITSTPHQELLGPEKFSVLALPDRHALGPQVSVREKYLLKAAWSDRPWRCIYVVLVSKCQLARSFLGHLLVLTLVRTPKPAGLSLLQ
jgi:hypothetical protein